MHGTIDEGFDLKKGSYIAIKDPSGAQALKDYFGKENVVTILVEVNDGIRLMRALTREFSQEKPQYAEICRRFLSDEKDFENIKPDFRISNDNVIKATAELRQIIKANRK